MGHLLETTYGNTANSSWEEIENSSTDATVATLLKEKERIKHELEDASDLLMSTGFLNEVERIKHEFQKSSNDLQKFPKINEDAWK